MSRQQPVTAAQWVGAKRLSDGEPATRSLIATVLGVDDSAVYARATAGNWRTLDFRRKEVKAAFRHAVELAATLRADELDQADADDLDAYDRDDASATTVADGFDSGPSGTSAAATEPAPQELSSEEANAFIRRRLARIVARAERRGGRFDKAEVDALASMSRVADRSEEAKAEQIKQDAIKSDDELAAMLELIDERISEMAEAYAERLGGTDTGDRLG